MLQPPLLLQPATPRRRRPLLLEDGGQPPPQAIQSMEQLRRGGDFIPNFRKSDQQVRALAALLRQETRISSQRLSVLSDQQARPAGACPYGPAAAGGVHQLVEPVCAGWCVRVLVRVCMCGRVCFNA